VTLLVDCRDGKVVGVVALVGPNVEQSDYLLDPSVLRLQDGKLSGDIDFSVLFTEGDSMVTRDLQPVKVKFSLEVGADAKGVLTGTAKGTSGESAFSVAVKGDIVAATPSRDAHRVWLHFEDYGDGGHGGYTVLTAANGVLGAGHVLFYKGGKIGTASAKDGKLEGNRLQGTVGLEIDGHGQKASLTLPLTGVIFGNRLIFGTWTDAKGVKRTFRGGLVPAEGPQFESCNAEQKAILKSLQKASGEQKSPAKNNE
jgi:hypothetical protein